MRIHKLACVLHACSSEFSLVPQTPPAQVGSGGRDYSEFSWNYEFHCKFFYRKLEWQARATAMELLAEASKLPEPQQRKVAAVLGALVADAAGMHYSACFTRLPEYPACKTNQVEFIRGSLYWAVNICKKLHIFFILPLIP